MGQNGRVLAKNVRFLTRKVRQSPSGGLKKCDILRHFATFTRKSGRRPGAPAPGVSGSFNRPRQSMLGGWGRRGEGLMSGAGLACAVGGPSQGAWVPVSSTRMTEGGRRGVVGGSVTTGVWVPVSSTRMTEGGRRGELAVRSPRGVGSRVRHENDGGGRGA